MVTEPPGEGSPSAALPGTAVTAARRRDEEERTARQGRRGPGRPLPANLCVSVKSRSPAKSLDVAAVTLSASFTHRTASTPRVSAERTEKTTHFLVSVSQGLSRSGRPGRFMGSSFLPATHPTAIALEAPNSWPRVTTHAPPIPRATAMRRYCGDLALRHSPAGLASSLARPAASPSHSEGPRGHAGPTSARARGPRG